MEVGDGLGQLVGVESGQEVLEVAKCAAGLAEHVRVRHEVVGHGVFDEPVDTPCASVDLGPGGAGGGAHDVQRLLALGFEGGGDELDVAHQVRRIGEDGGVHPLEDVAGAVRGHQIGGVDMAVPVWFDAVDGAFQREVRSDVEQGFIGVVHDGSVRHQANQASCHAMPLPGNVKSSVVPSAKVTVVFCG